MGWGLNGTGSCRFIHFNILNKIYDALLLDFYYINIPLFVNAGGKSNSMIGSHMFHSVWVVVLQGAVCPRFCMLMFVLLIGSFIWCFVASACDVELLIVKSASVAVLIAGVRPILVLSNSQSFISLLSMIGVEFRRLVSDIRCCLCVMFAHVYGVISHFSALLW